MPVHVNDTALKAAAKALADELGVDLTIGMNRVIATKYAQAAITAYLSALPATPSDMASFGASHVACYLYPGEDQAKERAAFCAGAGQSLPQGQERERLRTIINSRVCRFVDEYEEAREEMITTILSTLIPGELK